MFRKIISIIFSLISIVWLFGVWKYLVRSMPDIWIFAISTVLATPLWLVIAKAERQGERITSQVQAAKYMLGGLVVIKLIYAFVFPEADSHFIDLVTLSSYYGVWFTIGVKVFEYFS